MKGLKFTKQTEQVSFVFFTLYFIYGLFYTPFVQYLVCLAIGGITYGISNSAEISIVMLLGANYLFGIMKEGFANPTINVREEKAKVRVENYPAPEPLGGVGSKLSEGFADASETDMSVNETKVAKPDVSVGVSKPAELKADDMGKMAEMMKKMMETMNTKDVLESSKATKISEDNIPPAHQPQEKETFQESQGLFKLGKIPTDEKGGHHIDVGTTVINAINSLKPDQIKAMTMDTKQLIETQKSLMGMLQTFQPMVHEGKQMMETFQEMFSPAMGAKV